MMPEPQREDREASSKRSSTPPASRKVNRSCIECTRRKVKCDGRQPCGSCVYYRAPEACGYRQRSKRNAVSRSTFDRASEQLRVQSHVLDTLFPGVEWSDLADKSRDDLFDMVRSHMAGAHPLPLSHQRLPPHVSAPRPRDSSAEPNGADAVFQPNSGADDSAPMSENGDAPAEGQWDESLDTPANVASDDINAIGLAIDQRARSYLGITSMSAVFKAIFRLCPAVKQHAGECAKGWAATPVQVLPSFQVLGRDPAMDYLREQRCIDFYFEHIHAITPLIDEEDFRMQYASGTRQDSSWMALLSMVFAMGSIASGSESMHKHYYRQARSFTSLDSLGSGNLDSLQALCILGGYYLHYRNSPNMAYGILGAAHRFALALGLHRESRRTPSITDAMETQTHRRRVETRRRTWWSLVCVDTWASMTQGRPTCGRWDSTTMDTQMPTPLHADDHAATSLQASAQFCLIFDRIQHRFAEFSRPTTHEILAFDADLEAWYESLPASVKQVDSSPPRYQIAREFMRTRYLNSRIILSRSLILYIAYDCKKKSVEPLPDQRQIIDSCCRVASEAIDSIALYWTPNRIHVWNSAWYLFQACMIPLLRMAIERNMPQPSPSQTFPAWQASLAKALETFTEMRPWMRTSDRSPDIVSALYEALLAESDGQIRTPSATDGGTDLFGWYDEQLTELDWSVFLGGGDELTQGIFPVA